MLHSVYTPSGKVVQANVVFVHGLGGNGTSYWGMPKSGNDFWLYWLGKELEDVTIWTLEYEAAPAEWLGPTMPLVDRAGNVLNYLRDLSLTNAPLIFVVHSLGGLLLKQMIRSAETSNANEWQALIPLFRGVCFLGTPHQGSHIASFMQQLPKGLGLSVTTHELTYNNAALRDLSKWYQDNALRLEIKTAAYFETRKTVGKSKPARFLSRHGDGLMIVDQVSADPGIQGVRATGLDHDHLSMVTPTTKADQVYIGVRAFIRSCLSSTAEPAPAKGEPHTLPYEMTKFFTGHDAEYKQLEATLEVGNAALTQPAALKGMGGVGKTQLALKFATEHQAQFPSGIFWIPAETADGAQQKLLEYTGRFAPELIVEQQPETTALRFCDWLAAQGEFLAIFDNADDFEPTKHYAEVLRKAGRLLYTTRARHLPAHVADISVKTLPKALGGQLLLKCMGKDEPTQEEVAEAEALSERLGGLPLAIDQAGAYLKQTARSIAWYAEQYEAKGKLLRKKYGATGQSAEHASVATTFSLALERLEEKSPASADLMRVLAFLNPESIPESMFAAGAEYLGERLGPLATEEIEWDGVVGAARQLSLLERSEPPGYLSLHRVVQDVIKDTLDEHQKLSWITAAVGAVRSITPDINSIDWWKPLGIATQWQPVINEASTLSVKTIEFAYLLSAFATWRHYRGIYPQTTNYFKLALEIVEAIHGSGHPYIAIVLNNSAGFLQTIGRYQESELSYRRALTIGEAIYRPDHPEIATTLNNLSALLKAKGQYQEAEQLQRRALKIREAHLGYDHLDVAISLNNLAALLQETGQYQEAEQFHRRSLKIRKTQLPPSDPYISVSLNNLAYLLQITGQYQEAESLHRQALNIRETQLGSMHPSVAESLGNLGLLLQTIGNYDESEIFYRRALYIFESTYEHNHPNIATSLCNLAHILQISRRYQESEQLYRRALDIFEAIHGSIHQNIAINLNNLAELLRIMRRYQEAEPLYRKALAIYETIHGSNHPDVAGSLNNLALLLQTTGRYQEAEELSRRTFLIISPLRGTAYPHIKTMAQVWLDCLQSAHKNQIALANEVPKELVLQALMITGQGTEQIIPSVSSSFPAILPITTHVVRRKKT